MVSVQEDKTRLKEMASTLNHYENMISEAARLHIQMKARSKQRAETAEAKYEADSKVLKSEHTKVIKELKSEYSST
jgi:hypothetical protein